MRTTLEKPQLYYSDMSTGIDNINPGLLEGIELTVSPEPGSDNIENFIPSDEQIILTNPTGDLIGRLTPSLRIKFDTDYWFNKIIAMEGQPELSNLNNFRDYFRGIYIKAESTSSVGNMTLLNLADANANITLYYTRLDENSEDNERIEGTYVLNFTGNRVNFVSNDFTIPDGNETTGDENLFIKGGQGSIAEIKLFNGEDIDDDNTTDNAFETFKKEFVETDEEGNFVSIKKLVNEANLVFYVNQAEVNGNEPDRIYIYDTENEIFLEDYDRDFANTTSPVFSRTSHLGPLQRVDDEVDGEGIKYKIRITEHINNLLLSDSTNVKTGLGSLRKH